MALIYSTKVYEYIFVFTINIIIMCGMCAYGSVARADVQTLPNFVSSAENTGLTALEEADLYSKLIMIDRRVELLLKAMDRKIVERKIVEEHLDHRRLTRWRYIDSLMRIMDRKLAIFLSLNINPDPEENAKSLSVAVAPGDREALQAVLSKLEQLLFLYHQKDELAALKQEESKDQFNRGKYTLEELMSHIAYGIDQLAIPHIFTSDTMELAEAINLAIDNIASKRGVTPVSQVIIANEASKLRDMFLALRQISLGLEQLCVENPSSCPPGGVHIVPPLTDRGVDVLDIFEELSILLSDARMMSGNTEPLIYRKVTPELGVLPAALQSQIMQAWLKIDLVIIQAFKS